MVHLLLASNSARRRELIQLTGWDVLSTSANIDETPHPMEDPRAHVSRLAMEKARAILARGPDRNVLTADTIVVDQGTILGKPLDDQDALRILKQLRGHAHEVMTAIVLYELKSRVFLADLCVSRVPMREYTDQEIGNYIASGDPMDKAGAYAIQNRFFHPVEKFSDCFASVMGMPLCHLQRTAEKIGMTVLPGLQDRCQAKLAYRCKVYKGILQGDIISRPKV